MRIQIQYVNEYGEMEAGIDIGGLFKDLSQSSIAYSTLTTDYLV